METFWRRTEFWPKSDPTRGLLLIVALLMNLNLAHQASADTHPLYGVGETRMEAEDYSAASVGYPFAEYCWNCSGEANLGYYWANSWFEMDVDAEQLLNYSVSLRAASPSGTQIEIQMIDESGAQTSLATIDVPSTGSWWDYTDTESVTLSLPSGIQILRFKNLGHGANIDYLTFVAGDEDDVVSFYPSTNAGPDINPLKGFNSGWWRNDDYASVGFQYIEWGKFEPEDDEFDWDYVESVLDRPGTRGRHFILQFVVDWDWKDPVDSNYLGPDWLLARVGEVRGTADPNDPDSRQMRATRYNDPEFIAESAEAIKALLDHYRDDPRTFVLQVGILGFWGEWHTFPRMDWSPTDETKRTILNAYLDNLGTDGLTQVRYPHEPVNVPQPGMGYTNGSVVPTPHGYDFGIEIAAQELWRNGPVGGEWPPNVEDQYWHRFFETEEGEFFLFQGGYSTAMVPEFKHIAAKLPGWTPEERFMKMHRQLGYNFRADAIRHLVSVDDSKQTHIEIELHNDGIAPFYKNWEVQVAILNGDSGEVVDLIKTDVDIRVLGPDETITVTGSSSAELDPQREYEIGLRILQPCADEPKDAAWRLNARNVYVVLANDSYVIDGVWDNDNALEGGWNILSFIQP